MTAINRGFFVSAVISLVRGHRAAFLYLPAHFSELKGVTGRRRSSATAAARSGWRSARC